MTVSPKDPLHPGEMLGPYEVGALIARGHTNAVYEATHKLTGKHLAVRILLPEHAQNPLEMKRCMHAAKAIARIKTEGVVEIYDLGITGSGLPYTAMERLKGRSLKDILQEERSLSAPRIRRLFGQISKSMVAVHAKHVVHRDLKPANFIVAGGGEESEKVTIIDFDACLTQEPGLDSEREQITVLGAIVGTPHYMSPEQCMGTQVDQRSDIYALGCSMFEAMTGKMPILGDTAVDTMARHITGQPQLPADLDPEYKGLSAVILKCLEKKAEERYQSMADLHHDLVGDQVNTKAGKSFRNKF